MESLLGKWNPKIFGFPTDLAIKSMSSNDADIRFRYVMESHRVTMLWSMVNRIDTATGVNVTAASSYNVLADNTLLASAKVWYHSHETNVLRFDRVDGPEMVVMQKTV